VGDELRVPQFFGLSSSLCGWTLGLRWPLRGRNLEEESFEWRADRRAGECGLPEAVDARVRRPGRGERLPPNCPPFQAFQALRTYPASSWAAGSGGPGCANRPTKAGGEPFFAAEGRGEYERMRNDPECGIIREVIESRWEEYFPFADSDFLEKSRKHDFRACWWEMYLGCSLLGLGLELEPRKTRGHGSAVCNERPDLRIVGPWSGWVEACAPEAGLSPDGVPDDVFGRAQDVPDGPMKLRLLGAIRNKAKQRLAFLRSGVVEASEPYVVAINVSKIRHVADFDPPRVVRAVLGLGMPQVSKDLRSGQMRDAGFRDQPSIMKEKGGTVSTRIFLDPGEQDESFVDHAGISAVLTSEMNPFNSLEPWFDHKRLLLGDDFIMCHNDAAHDESKLERGSIRIGREYWVSDAGTLECRRWLDRCASIAS